VLLADLRLENLRNLEALQLRPQPGINLLTGPNGAGKTSILEGIYLLSHAGSFRTARSEVLLRDGAVGLSVFGQLDVGSRTVKLGLAHAGDRWVARVDGSDAPNLTTLLRCCAVVCFEPGSHALISGPAEERRRFLDWGVFHVEQDFADVVRRYRRGLRQRNAVLRDQGSDAELDAWDDELGSAGEALAGARNRYLDRFTPLLEALAQRYLPELGALRLRRRDGWPREVPLRQALREGRIADRERAHSTRGPHRADWLLGFERLPRREHLSRGQEKLCALACTLAQAQLYHDDHSEWPIVILDDLPSELDQAHQALTLASLEAVSQVFISSTDMSPALERAGGCRFHVEQGRIVALV
jgi:DNA replication and repair protein RecF